MKKALKNKSLIFVLILICVAVISAFGVFSSKTASAISVDNNYRFDSINVDITVNKDKTFAVTETLEVSFLFSGVNTGIIRDIQRVSKTTRIVNGKKKSSGTYIAGLSDVSATFDGGYCKLTQSLYNNGEFYAVKMQQSTGYIEEGVHTFVLNYVYDMSDDKVSGFDDFTFDVLGYSMAFTSEFNATVTFPVDAELSDVTFRTNDLEKWQPAQDLGEYATVEGNVIRIHAYPQAKEVGYTVQVIFPDGYLSEAQKTFYWYYIIFATVAFAAIVVIVGLMAISIPKKPIETVEFYPPEGMPVMRFASIWKMGAKTDHTASLILKWAGEGIISIEADGAIDCNLKVNLNPDVKFKEGMKLTDRLKKSAKKCFDTEGEKLFFNFLFSGVGGDGFTFSTAHFRAFANYEQKKRLYEITKFLTREGDKEPTASFENRNKYRTAVLFVSLVPTVMIVIYNCILNASALPVLFLLFMVVGNLPILHLDNMKIVIPIIFPIAFYGMTYGMFYFLFGLTAYDYCGLMYIAPVLWALGAFVLRFFMPDKRTPSVTSDYGKMLGFKRFLLTAELPRIQRLFDENPFYFSEILPYCLIMGISEKVKKRFASLSFKMPEYLERGINIRAFSTSISRSCSSGAPRSSGGGGGGHGGSSGGGGGGGGSRGC